MPTVPDKHQGRTRRSGLTSERKSQVSGHQHVRRARVANTRPVPSSFAFWSSWAAAQRRDANAAKATAAETAQERPFCARSARTNSRLTDSK